jgi:hypothetical protein
MPSVDAIVTDRKPRRRLTVRSVPPYRPRVFNRPHEVAMSLIELGDPGSAEQVPARRRTLPATDRRRLLAAAVLILCLITVNASARPTSLFVSPRWTIDIGNAAIVFPSGRAVYVRPFAN